MSGKRARHHGVECALYRRDLLIRELTAERDAALRKVEDLAHQLEAQRAAAVRRWGQEFAA